MISPGLPCPGVVLDLSQGKWMAILINPDKHLKYMHRLGVIKYNVKYAKRHI